MFIPISERAFVPMHRIERVSFFGVYATIKYTDQREPERIDGEDAQRLMLFVSAANKKATETTATAAQPKKGKTK